MSSEAITRNDLTAILNEVLPPTPSEYRTLLWTNPSPSSAFAAQTVSVDADEYDSIEVEFNGTATPLTMSVRESTYYAMTPAYNGIPSYRAAKLPTTNGVWFDECHKNSGSTIENTYLAPYKIYGIKYERVNPPQIEIFRGADGSRYEVLANGSTFTPTNDGWARVCGSTTSGYTYPSVINITQSGGVIASATGITYAGSKTFCTAPVKAGLTYGIDLYRCTLDDIIVFY